VRPPVAPASPPATPEASEPAPVSEPAPEAPEAPAEHPSHLAFKKTLAANKLNKHGYETLCKLLGKDSLADYVMENVQREVEEMSKDEGYTGTETADFSTLINEEYDTLYSMISANSFAIVQKLNNGLDAEGNVVNPLYGEGYTEGAEDLSMSVTNILWNVCTRPLLTL
jgi:hypothetical protein